MSAVYRSTTPLTVEYCIDDADRLVSVNDFWDSFAQANSSAELLSPAILHQSLWTYIGDDTTRHLYEQIFRQVRRQQRIISFPLRCDSPNRRRWLRFSILPWHDEHLLLSSRLIRSVARPSIPLLDPQVPRTDDLLTMCSWCAKIHTGRQQWVDVEEFVARLRIFYQSVLPRLTHTICPTCLFHMEQWL